MGHEMGRALTASVNGPYRETEPWKASSKDIISILPVISTFLRLPFPINLAFRKSFYSLIVLHNASILLLIIYFP